MEFFRWIVGVPAVLLAGGAVLAFVLFIIGGVDVWLERARAWRRLTFALVMFWFNVEIWRRVILIIVNW
ncbi:hypothetical protein [Piscinibacter sp.]|uniref:hypothetical protein n=1 Tax=Piscinibacter sp. TaxID=1903157 RepID=UPI002D077458|nr:hypothetical protein [Albitalea sp.]HUG23851.1 hypothetical protein [Albitalea sp.]